MAKDLEMRLARALRDGDRVAKVKIIDLCQESYCMEEATSSVTVHGDRMDSDAIKLCGAHREVIERKAKRAGMTVTATPHFNGARR